MTHPHTTATDMTSLMTPINEAHGVRADSALLERALRELLIEKNTHGCRDSASDRGIGISDT